MRPPGSPILAASTSSDEQRAAAEERQRAVPGRAAEEERASDRGAGDAASGSSLVARIRARTYHPASVCTRSTHKSLTPEAYSPAGIRRFSAAPPPPPVNRRPVLTAPPTCSSKAALLAALAVLLAAAPRVRAPAAQAATPCWKKLLNDWYDGRIDHTYPIACYRDALKHLPADVQTYSSAKDDILRALQSAIATRKAKHESIGAGTLVPPQKGSSGGTGRGSNGPSGTDAGGAHDDDGHDRRPAGTRRAAAWRAS